MARPSTHVLTVALLAAARACGESPGAAPPATLAEVTVNAPGSTHEAHLLRFDVAERIADAFFECANRKGKPRTLHIIDQFGETIYAARMDGQFADNVDVARMKARTALYFRENTRVWRNRGTADPLMALWTAQLGQFTSPTGLPIIVEDQLLGAVGIGGASGDCAHEALRAVLGPQPPLEPPPLPPRPASSTRGSWTDEEVLRWNPNPSREHQVTPWPAHRIIDNVYYVGTRNLASFLIDTPDGLILINSNDEETLPLVRRSVEELGFTWADIRIVLASHAHADHMSANPLIREQTGARIMAMRQDLPLLEQMSIGGLRHHVDRVLEHGDTVALGGETLTAHRTAGHTPGTTTWTLDAEENGETYHVVFLGGATATPRTDVTSPEVQRQFQEAFVVLRGLPCDVPLGPHAPIHRMEEKFARLATGGAANPYIDPQGCRDELGLSERVFYLLLAKQLGTAGT